MDLLDYHVSQNYISQNAIDLFETIYAIKISFKKGESPGMRKVTANNYVECQRDSIGKVVTRENEGGTRGLEKNHHYRIPIH